MHLSAIALQLAGAVMLLLYSTRMVRTGFERAAGPALRELLLRSSSNAPKGVFTGVMVATLLQSSTAVALLVAGFASTGAISLIGALSIVLGADLGTALVVQFLSLDLAWLIPALLVCGGFFFLKLEARMAKQIGRVILGIAFILLSLKMIGEATTPLRSSTHAPAVVSYLSEDVFTAFLGGAALAFLFHSSVAAVLLFATFSAQSVLPIDAGLPLVLGANAGGGLVALWLTRDGRREARRITLGNFIFRAAVAVAVLLLVHFVGLPVHWLGDSAERQLVNFHFVFNVVLLLVCLPFTGLVIKLTNVLIKNDPEPVMDRLHVTSALDPAVLNRPELALTSVTRELLRMSQLVETMAGPLLDLFTTSQPDQVEHIRTMDKHVNEAHTEIKLYIAELNGGQLSSDEARRGVELTSMAINLERVGDIIAKDLLPRVDEKHNKRQEFSQAGWREISVLHARVITNMQLALNVLVSEDLESAKQLVLEKTRMGKLERETRNRHLGRLMKGTPESIATSDLHLEVVRALKEINSLYTAVAYPILSKYGVLLDNRIRKSSAR